MNLRFRKSFTIIPHFLKWTLSKRGASLNLKLGPLSKSWGTGGRRSTNLDAPGELGLSWRSERQASGSRLPHPQNTQASTLGILGAFSLFFILFLAQLTRIYVHPFATCVRTGHPFRDLLLVSVCTVGVWLLATLLFRMKSTGSLILAVLLGIGQWMLLSGRFEKLVQCVSG